MEWILTDRSEFFCSDTAGSSVVVHDDPTSRGPTTAAAAADATAADPHSPAAPSPAPAAESTHVTPGTIYLETFDKQGFLSKSTSNTVSLFSFL